jgi:hypothetical protein
MIDREQLCFETRSLPPSLAASLAVLPSMSLIPSSSIVLIRSNHETLDRLAGDKSIHNLGDVRGRNASVEKVIGFDQNRHAGGALIETARCADARLELGESARSNLLFQRSIHFFRVLGRAASFRIVLGPTINADKEIALPLQRGESRVRRIGRQRPKNSNCVLAITDDT